MSSREHLESISEPSPRRERAAIAAQACETCRSRKSKCDEQRPRCGLCRRLDIDCVYREPLPTKKDKTLVQILDALARIENKFDNLPISSQQRTVSEDPSASSRPSQDTLITPKQVTGLTNAQRTLTWPSIYLHLVSTHPQASDELQHIFHQGSSWFIRQEAQRHPAPLQSHAGLPSVPITKDGQTDPIITFPWLTIQQVHSYTEAYFHTFNVFHPLLEQQRFTDEISSPLMQNGYAYGDARSIIALLVYALGQLALEGTLDKPLSDQPRSGIRGGIIHRPPGLEIFHEARKRLSIISSHATLDSVIIHLLAAMYYDANALHLDFWKATWCASMACQTHIRCWQHDLQAPESEMLRKVYWMVCLNESVCRYDLDMPVLALGQYRDIVPALSYQLALSPFNSVNAAEDRPTHHLFFSAIVQLDRLINEIYTMIIQPSNSQSESSGAFIGPAIPIVREMARQLEGWRSLLPRPLQWADSEMLQFPKIETGRSPSDPLFAPDQGAVPIRHRYNLDIMTAYLRTRFYYARHLIYQPFVYKALHFAELLTKDDVDNVAMALKSACLWPLLMAPPKDKKRLIPHLSSWSQIFTSILLIFEMTRINETLRNIAEDHVSREEIEQTISLMMEWMRDMKQIDGFAEHGWMIIEPLFAR